VEVIKAPPPSRDVGWWFTTFAPVVIAAFALVVAIVSVRDANSSAKTAEIATARTYASLVSFTSGPAASQLEIDNGAAAPITLVLVQPGPHEGLHELGTIQRCTGITFSLPGASTAVMFFRDANGLSWELPVNGVAEPSADPDTIISLVPSTAISPFSSSQMTTVQLHSC